jgi:glycerophosphoryl diester phosphodiesterase
MINPQLPRIMGHRGAPTIAPENTLLGFEAALRAGATWTETDACLLGDGTPVIFHDATLDRCTDRTGSIDSITAADLTAVDANQSHPALGPQPIPTLAQALAFAAETGMGLNLELKRHDHVSPEALVSAVLPVLRAGPLGSDRLLLSSFDFDVLRLARAALPETALAVIAEEASDAVFALAADIQAHSLNLWWETLSHEDVRRARAKGLSVNIWTANAPAKVASMVEWGVQGIMSDCPQDYA